MYRVLIVDDEKIVRVALKSIVDWGREGFEVCDSLNNGADGLDAIGRLHPHFVIADIKMPKMDGLTFVTKARSLGFDGEVVILSNYKKFSYAVEALHNNVMDYICKTDINPESLLSIVRKARARLDKRYPLSEALVPGYLELDMKLLESALQSRSENTPLSRGYMITLMQRKRQPSLRQDQTPPSALNNILQELNQQRLCYILQVSPSAAACLIPQDHISE